MLRHGLLNGSRWLGDHCCVQLGLPARRDLVVIVTALIDGWTDGAHKPRLARCVPMQTGLFLTVST